MRRRVLEDLCKEEDVESSTRKLVDQVANLKDKRFQAMIKLKVSRAFMLTANSPTLFLAVYLGKHQVTYFSFISTILGFAY
jgi:hypothetical protein